MKNDRDWIVTKPKGVYSATLDGVKGEQDDKDATKGDAKKGRRSKKGRATGTSDTTEDGEAYTLQSPRNRTPDGPRIRKFTLNDVELEGDVSPPKPAEEHLPRKFKRTDNGREVSLMWCWLCGRGMWKHHNTSACPKRRAEAPGGPTPSASTETPAASEPTPAAATGGTPAGSSVRFQNQAVHNREQELQRPTAQSYRDAVSGNQE